MFLRMSQLERKVLIDIIVQQLNRENVMEFVRISYDRIQNLKS